MNFKKREIEREKSDVDEIKEKLGYRCLGIRILLSALSILILLF